MTAVAPHPEPAGSACRGDVPADRSGWPHPVLGLLAGAVAGALVYAGLASALAPGWLALMLLLGLLVAVPSAAELSRRIAINGAWLLGWSPVLWWVDVGHAVDRGALVLSSGVVVLVAMAAGAADRRKRVRAMLPVVRAVDALPLLGGLAALAVSWSWAFPGSAKDSLRALLPGVDSVAHFHMFATIRAYGATTTALPPGPDGTGWSFDGYPQGFHALAATVSEMLQPHLDVGPATLMAYTRAYSLLLVLGTVVLTAAAVSLPGLRNRPLIALPTVTLTWAAFLWEPGQKLLADGFGNFWVACAAVGVALLLSLGSTSAFARAEIVAVSGLMVLVAHSWAPLLALAAPAGLVLLMPLRASLRDPALRKRVLFAAAVFLVGLLCVLKAVVGLFVQVGVQFVVTATGGISGASPLPVLVLLLVGGYACLAAPRLLAGSSDGAVVLAARRARVLALVVVGGLVMVVALLVLQVRASATGSYYLLKFVMGYELVLAALVPAVAGMLLASRLPAAQHRWLAGVAAVVATVLAAQAFAVFPDGLGRLQNTERGGTATVRAPYSGERMASGVLAAVSSTSSQESFQRDYIALGPHAAGQVYYPDAWYHAILASMSQRAGERFGGLRVKALDVDHAAPLVRRLLEDQPRLRVIVAPRFFEPMRRALGSSDLAARVVTWDSNAS
jgi:hypothetical protein